MKRLVMIAAVVAWSAAAACGGTEVPTPAPATATAAAPAPVANAAPAPTLAEQLVVAAKDYQAWGKVDRRPNIAPMKCDSPTVNDYGTTGDVRLSQADDASPHARKLYYLYASDRAGYLGLNGSTAAIPVGFTVVKESFTPKITTHEEITANSFDLRRLQGSVYATHDDVAAPGQTWVQTAEGQYLTPDQRMDLFVMTKVAERAADGTDVGWIYGTIAVDGTVTSVGRVETCMGCHVDQAPHERLFGLRPR